MSVNYETGIYQAKVLDHGIAKAKTGTPEFFLHFQILNKVGFDGAAVECKQLEGTYYKAVTENAIDWLIDDLKAIDVEFDSLAKLDPQNEGAVHLIGRVITVICKHELYEGRMREKWGIHKMRNKLSGDDLRELDITFAHRLPKKCAVTPPARRNDSAEPI